MRWRSLTLALATGLCLGACSASASPTATAPPSDLALHSAAFADGGEIPVRFTCDGQDVTPPLAWDGVPQGAAAFALLVEDPDAGGFVHWVLTDIPGDLRALPEGQGDALGTPGQTSFGGTGWGGPCPPSGEHHYLFTLLALSAPLGLGTDAGVAEVRAAAADLLLGSAQLTGVYARGG